MNNIIIVGAGVFGLVLAERIATVLKKKVTIIDKRSHIGGNCYSFIDKETGINCHAYGSHIFHTSNDEVYDYFSKFACFNNYIHRVLTSAKGVVYPMPIGLETINKFYHKNLRPEECKLFIRRKIQKDHVENVSNLEEQTINLIGKDLYNTFIKGYTTKQWQREPKYLPSFIIKRLPFRFNYETSYFADKYQGIPICGYTDLFNKMICNNLIDLKLSTDFNKYKPNISSSDYIVYTGPIDEFYNYEFGKLQWRSLDFKWERYDIQDYQGIAVMNEADIEVPYTRTHEFKHYHPENVKVFTSNKTIICREYSKECQNGDIPYYPIEDSINVDLYEKYKKLNKNNNLIFGGRLGLYKYFDMDKAIYAALNTFDLIKPRLKRDID